MKINASINGMLKEFNLYDFQYWNQRLFCLGMSSDGNELKKFISTKGFDKLLIESDIGPSFHFTREHFNPYLCSREKDVFKESQLIEKHLDKFKTEDIGQSKYTGHYTICSDLGPYRDDLYFETTLFETSKFDLFQYQTDDLYYIQHQSKNKDNEFPVIVNQFDANIFGKVFIIHGVNEDGSKDYLDFSSLYHICDADLGYPSVNSFYSIIRANNFSGLLHIVRVGCLDLIRWDEISSFKQDCGNDYIKKNILKKNVKKKHCFRYLYEYYNNINYLITPRRKQSIKVQTGPKEFRKFDWIPVFTFSEMMDFKIVLFKDIFTNERKKDLSRFIAGDCCSVIHGFYNYKQGYVEFEDFNSSAELIKFIKTNLGIAESIRLSKVLSTWFNQTFGYAPRHIILPIAPKANSHALTDRLSIYSIPEFEEDGECYSTKTYINLYSLYAAFGIHILKIRNILKMNEFSTTLFKELDYSCEIYHVCRDIRRGVFTWNSDAELDSCMIEMQDGLRLIKILATIGDKKNSYWYSNANNIFQSFPDLPGDSVSEGYDSIPIRGYINEAK